MRLVRIIIRTADNGRTVRWGTSAQDIEAVKARYLETIPGAVVALHIPGERIDEQRARAVYWMQRTHWELAEARRTK